MNNKLKVHPMHFMMGTIQAIALSNGPRTVLEPKKVKEVHAMVQEITKHTLHMQPGVDRNWPGFASLITQA